MTDVEAAWHLEHLYALTLDELLIEVRQLAVCALRERADYQRQEATRREAARELDILLQSV